MNPFQFRSSDVPTINNNLDSKIVNPDGAHYTGGFGSNEVACHNNIPAFTRLQSGGRTKKIRRKIKNIVNKYKKMRGRMTLGGIRRRLTKMMKTRGGKMMKTRGGKMMKTRGGKMMKKCGGKMSRKRAHRQRGGYSQYESNIPAGAGYSTGGNLSPSSSALANPVPFASLPRTVNGIDNYNHFTKTGFQV